MNVALRTHDPPAVESGGATSRLRWLRRWRGVVRPMPSLGHKAAGSSLWPRVR